MALAAVIRSSRATTMMELEIELKKASDKLKVGNPADSPSPWFPTAALVCIFTVISIIPQPGLGLPGADSLSVLELCVFTLSKDSE